MEIALSARPNTSHCARRSGDPATQASAGHAAHLISSTRVLHGHDAIPVR
ncbi:MAG TPA: hypothetical protein VF003_07615 [Pseudonocardiaceae bacterium]